MRRSGWILAVAVLCVSGCGRDRKPTGPFPAPEFALRDISGKVVKLSDYKGHPVLLDFWATWCGPCRVSIPLVQEFYARHREEGLVVLGINMDDDPLSVPAFVKHYGMTYPVLLAGGSDIGRRYGMEGIPLFIFIDAQGRVVERFDGFAYSMLEAWELIFEQLMAPNPSS